jgi:hypothetical protein
LPCLKGSRRDLGQVDRPGCNSGCAAADHGVSSWIERVLKLRYCTDAAESRPICVSMVSGLRPCGPQHVSVMAATRTALPPAKHGALRGEHDVDNALVSAHCRVLIVRGEMLVAQKARATRGSTRAFTSRRRVSGVARCDSPRRRSFTCVGSWVIGDVAANDC